MNDIRLPKYDWGRPVTAAVDLLNDGSHPHAAAAARLVEQGSRGMIVNVGHHAEANVPVYLVEFANGCVVGCLEDELAPA
jgi:nitrogen fixation protein NifZ